MESSEPTTDRLSGRFLFSSPRLAQASRSLALPDEMVTGVLDINFGELARRGLRHFCFDVDNTLVGQYSNQPPPGMVEHLKAGRESGFIQKICLLSNTISGVRKRLRLERIAEMFDIPDFFGCGFWIRKPHPLGYFWAEGVLQAPASSIVMVGDQVYTDILGGNRAGMHTILVNPLSADHWTTAIIGRRQRESLLFARHSVERPNGGRSNLGTVSRQHQPGKGILL